MRIVAFWPFWEHVTEAAGAAESAEVVAWPAARTPIPHAPGARMTVVTLTPSNQIVWALLGLYWALFALIGPYWAPLGPYWALG